MSTPEPPVTPTTKVSMLPVYTIVGIVITGALAVFSLIFICIVMSQSRTLDDEDLEDLAEPPKKAKSAASDSSIDVDPSSPAVPETQPQPQQTDEEPVEAPKKQEKPASDVVENGQTNNVNGSPQSSNRLNNPDAILYD